MPRLDPRLVRLTQAQDRLLAKLLPVNRDIESARNELRWLKQHAVQKLDSLPRLVHRRAAGEPLQYILGSEYFGNLEIQCRPGVLIPRHETAASISFLVHRLQTKQLLPTLRMLDLCTGTGCIPLLFHHEFYSDEHQASQLNLLGVDISPIALELAEMNKSVQIAEQGAMFGTSSARKRSLCEMHFLRADILGASQHHAAGAPSWPDLQQRFSPDQRHFDVLVSNPPYVSKHHYRTITEHSVRKFEPQLALVPEEGTRGAVADGDQFYPRLWDIADEVDAKILLFEVGDDEQALRVASMGAERGSWQTIEIWRDAPEMKGMSECVNLGKSTAMLLGMGKLRSIFATRGEGMKWTAT